MKALFLVGRPGHSTVIMNSWPWEKSFFRFEDEANGDTRQKDAELIEAVKQAKPDLVVYIAVCLSKKQLDGSEPFKGIPYDATFKLVRHLAPTVMICCDGGDAGTRGFPSRRPSDDPGLRRSSCWSRYRPVLP